MRPTKINTFVSAFSAVILSGILSASAQNAAPATPGTDNGGGRRGNFNPEEFRKRMEDRLKEALKVSDDEWGVIQPLLEKVQTKQRDAMGGRFGGFGGPGGGPGGGGRGGNRDGATAGGTTPAAAPAADANRPQRAGSAESQALRTTLDNASSTPDDIKAKLTAVRDVRKKSAAELEAARGDLRKVLTLRQEATLVQMGILE